VGYREGLQPEVSVELLDHSVVVLAGQTYLPGPLEPLFDLIRSEPDAFGQAGQFAGVGDREIGVHVLDAEQGRLPQCAVGLVQPLVWFTSGPAAYDCVQAGSRPSERISPARQIHLPGNLRHHRGLLSITAHVKTQAGDPVSPADRIHLSGGRGRLRWRLRWLITVSEFGFWVALG